jgi:hypothetical protein
VDAFGGEAAAELFCLAIDAPASDIWWIRKWPRYGALCDFRGYYVGTSALPIDCSFVVLMGNWSLWFSHALHLLTTDHFALVDTIPRYDLS